MAKQITSSEQGSEQGNQKLETLARFLSSRINPARHPGINTWAKVDWYDAVKAGLKVAGIDARYPDTKTFGALRRRINDYVKLAAGGDKTDKGLAATAARGPVAMALARIVVEGLAEYATDGTISNKGKLASTVAAADTSLDADYVMPE